MISFIIPAYNAEKLIGRCLESVVTQNAPFAYEVLVVDDGSADNTEKVVCELAEKHPQIRYLKKVNGGVSSARNFGLQNCKGEYVAFLDADDYLEPNAFAQLTGYEAFDFTVFGYYYVLSQRKIPITLNTPAETYDVQKGFAEIYRANMFNSVWNKLYKRELITQQFDESYVMGEDLLFNIHYYTNIRNFRLVNKPLYNYFVNENSATQKYNPHFIFNFIKTYDALVKLTAHLEIGAYPDIQVALLDNIAGTLRLLVFNKDYGYCMDEMKRIYEALQSVVITEKSRSAIHNCVYSLFKKKCYGLVFLLLRLMKVAKNLRK